MNKTESEEYRKADSELNYIYQKILTGYKSDTVFIDQLKKTQRIWITYRDAELEMKFPAENKQLEYGSVYPMCVSIFMKELTEERIEKLKNWISRTEKGDVCNGSVKIIENIDSEDMQKAFIEKSGSIWMTANMKKDHRIFGYKKKDIYSKKMILLSIYTNEVENNPFNCKYGAFYDTYGMTDLKLKYVVTENDFLRIEIIKDGKAIDEIYMLKKWFEFEE